jgi:hypothetical protein
MERKIRNYFADVWRRGMEYGWINVLYEGQTIMQIWNLPEGAQKKNIVLNFCPYSYGYSLVHRFKTCPYYPDFAAFDSEEDNYMQAAYGTDIDQALKVASYILSNVYEIPALDNLSLELSAPQEKW